MGFSCVLKAHFSQPSFTGFAAMAYNIMDEPEAALSPLRQMSMLTRIHDLVNDNSQLIIATHSPIIMAYPDAAIYEFSEEGIFKRKLEETNHYRIMKQFFENTPRMIHHLLTE